MTYVDRDYNAVYALNSYLWKVLEANLGWEPYQFDDKVAKPIIPAAQQPEFMQTGKPFIVYGSAVQPPGHLYALKTESVAYAVYSTDATECNRITNLLADCFERQDEAAADVNDWLGIENRTPKRGVSFNSIRLNMVERAEPTEQEGGFSSSLVLLEMKFTTSNTTAQFSGFTP